MSSLTRACSTDEQESAVEQLEKWATKHKFRLNFGCTIGKSPQTVILDHTYQDNCCYIDADGTIKIGGNEIVTEKDFIRENKKWSDNAES